MNIWIVSDTHLGHEKLAEDGIRDYDFEDCILDDIYSKVEEDDILINLGDIAFNSKVARADFWVSEVTGHRGRNWLIKGNHDRKSTTWYLEHGFDFCADSIILNKFGKRILLSHIPQRKTDDWDINVHGHIHSGFRQDEFDDILTENHILIEMETFYGVRDFNKLVDNKIQLLKLNSIGDAK